MLRSPTKRKRTSGRRSSRFRFWSTFGVAFSPPFSLYLLTNPNDRACRGDHCGLCSKPAIDGRAARKCTKANRDVRLSKRRQYDLAPTSNGCGPAHPNGRALHAASAARWTSSDMGGMSTFFGAASPSAPSDSRSVRGEAELVRYWRKFLLYLSPQPKFDVRSRRAIAMNREAKSGGLNHFELKASIY